MTSSVNTLELFDKPHVFKSTSSDGDLCDGCAQTRSAAVHLFVAANCIGCGKDMLAPVCSPEAAISIVHKTVICEDCAPNATVY